jgi:hypothetical protein
MGVFKTRGITLEDEQLGAAVIAAGQVEGRATHFDRGSGVNRQVAHLSQLGLPTHPAASNCRRWVMPRSAAVSASGSGMNSPEMKPP